MLEKDSCGTRYGQLPGGQWAVMLQDFRTIVRTRTEAELLASVEIEWAKLGAVGGGPDWGRVRQMVAIGRRYDCICPALDELAVWLKNKSAAGASVAAAA